MGRYWMISGESFYTRLIFSVCIGTFHEGSNFDVFAHAIFFQLTYVLVVLKPAIIINHKYLIQ